MLDCPGDVAVHRSFLFPLGRVQPRHLDLDVERFIQSDRASRLDFKGWVNVGKAKVQARIHQLNTQTKEALARLPNVRLHTPLSPELSSGLIAYEIDGMKPRDTIMQLFARGVVSADSPYHQSYARLAPSLLNSEQDIETTVGHIEQLATGAA